MAQFFDEFGNSARRHFATVRLSTLSGDSGYTEPSWRRSSFSCGTVQEGCYYGPPQAQPLQAPPIMMRMTVIQTGRRRMKFHGKYSPKMNQNNNQWWWNIASDGRLPVTFKPCDGKIVRTEELRRGIVSPHNGKATLINYRGIGTCGTCVVQVLAAATATHGSTTPEKHHHNRSGSISSSSSSSLPQKRPCTTTAIGRTHGTQHSRMHPPVVSTAQCQQEQAIDSVAFGLSNSSPRRFGRDHRRWILGTIV